ncbi:MAG TPA: DedA family protein [Steroidobacteraceae bacterium]|jgi:membrane protein DedA with SNARE-associated domain|nr:DedA family protein [Steroidobacteraceae bacterium]
MDLSALLHQYGYALIFLGTLAEGETLLVLGGYFAHRGYLGLGGVISTSFVAAVCGDQLFFHLGRRHAKGLMERFPRLREKVNIALRRIEDHQVKIALSMRFLWGLRIAMPVALGLTAMDARRFFWLNLLSAAVWSSLFALVGFGTSRVASQMFANLQANEKWVALALLGVAVVVLWVRWHGARLARTGSDAGG